MQLKPKSFQAHHGEAKRVPAKQTTSTSSRFILTLIARNLESTLCFVKTAAYTPIHVGLFILPQCHEIIAQPFRLHGDFHAMPRMLPEKPSY